MGSVFISYVHEDVRVAEAIQRFLSDGLKQWAQTKSGQKYEVFLYLQGPAGQNWLDRIEQELTGASVVVLMMSNRSVKRPWLNLEAGGAWFGKGNKKLIIPVCYGELKKESLPPPYSSLTAVELSKGKDYLLRSVKEYFGKLPSPDLYPPASTEEEPGWFTTFLAAVETLTKGAAFETIESALSKFQDEPDDVYSFGLLRGAGLATAIGGALASFGATLWIERNNPLFCKVLLVVWVLLPFWVLLAMDRGRRKRLPTKKAALYKVKAALYKVMMVVAVVCVAAYGIAAVWLRASPVWVFLVVPLFLLILMGARALISAFSSRWH
jgi:hypothetical protein